MFVLFCFVGFFFRILTLILFLFFYFFFFSPLVKEAPSAEDTVFRILKFFLNPQYLAILFFLGRNRSFSCSGKMSV